MKYLLLITLVLSCSSQNIEKSAPLFIKLTLLKNNKEIETGVTVTKLNKLTKIEKQRDTLNTSFEVLANKATVQGKKGFLINASVFHKSKKFGSIKMKNELSLQINKEASFDIIDQSQKITLKAFVGKVTTDKESKNKACMASIYGAQQSYKKEKGSFAESLDLLKTNINCPANSNLTMVKTNKDNFLALGVFDELIWVINQDKFLISAKK